MRAHYRNSHTSKIANGGGACDHSAHSARSRERFPSILEQTRARYRFVVVGYVVMPEHIYLLITGPEIGNPAPVMQVLETTLGACFVAAKKAKEKAGRRTHKVYASQSAPGRFMTSKVPTSRKVGEKWGTR